MGLMATLSFTFLTQLSVNVSSSQVSPEHFGQNVSNKCDVGTNCKSPCRGT